MYVQEVCRFMAARGHDVRVICSEASDAEPYTVRTEADGPVRVDRVNLPYLKRNDPDGWQSGIWGWRRHQRRMRQLVDSMLRDCRPTLVAYNTSRPFGEVTLEAVQEHGIPVVTMLHDAWLICPRVMLLRSPHRQPCPGPRPWRCTICLYSHYDQNWLYAALKMPWRIAKLGLYPMYRLVRRRKARRSVSAAFGYSHFMTSVHRPHIRGPVEHIPLGISLSRASTTRPLRPRTPVRFGFVGGFQGNKGIWHVFEAAKRLKSRGLTFELHVWGPDAEAGRPDVPGDLDDRVFFHGLYDSGARQYIYDDMDVAIMATTVVEPFGRVPLEAAASGAPTIAPGVGGLPESIRDGYDGLLYRFMDVGHLCEQMCRVLEEPGLLQALLANVQMPSDTSAMVPAVEAFYRRVLAAYGATLQHARTKPTTDDPTRRGERGGD